MTKLQPLMIMLLCLGTEAGVTPTLATRELPGSFVRNAGQWADSILYVACAQQYSIAIESRAIVVHKRPDYDTPGATVRLTLDAPSVDFVVRGEGKRETQHHFFVGTDPDRWATSISAYDRLVFEGSDGLSVVLNQVGGNLEYAVVALPGARASSLTFRYEGATDLRVEDGGVLVADTAAGSLRQRAPVAWQVDALGERTPVTMDHEVSGMTSRLVSTHRDLSRKLIVTPGVGLEWSTFLGGSNRDQASSVAQTADGRIIVAGQAASFDFPTTPGVYQPKHAGGQTLFFFTCSSKIPTTRGCHLIFSRNPVQN